MDVPFRGTYRGTVRKRPAVRDGGQHALASAGAFDPPDAFAFDADIKAKKFKGDALPRPSRQTLAVPMRSAWADRLFLGVQPSGGTPRGERHLRSDHRPGLSVAAERRLSGGGKIAACSEPWPWRRPVCEHVFE